MGGLGKFDVVGNALGLGGKQGASFQPQYNDELYSLMRDEAGAAAHESAGAQSNYIKDILSGQSGLSKIGGEMPRIQRAIAESPIAGTLMAQDILQQGPISGLSYGRGGELSKALSDVDAMRKPGAYGLTADDQTAYGQMSGDLARMFGQAEQGTAQDLASRGLAGGESGIAGKAYSGLQGNKMEQFAGLQRQIADQAMQRALQRDQMLRNYALNMQGMAGNDIQNQYGRQLAGVASARSPIMGGAGMEMNQNQMKNQNAYMAMQDQRAAYEPGMFDMLGGGIKNSAYQVGAAPGNFIGNASGSLGAAWGGGAGAKSGNYSGQPNKSPTIGTFGTRRATDADIT